MNTENLVMLAKYLEQPVLKALFTMDDFSEPGYHFEESCGSVGCAIGHGPYAGIPKTNEESWYSYSQRVFDLDVDSAEWKWCFDAEWKEVDNTPEGAAQRINYVLNNDLPDEFEEYLNDRDYTDDSHDGLKEFMRLYVVWAE